LLLGIAATLAAGPAVAAPVLETGDSVYVGEQIHISGSAMIFPVWKQTPADIANPGEPDFSAYCLEQTVHAQDEQQGKVGAIGSFIGTNFFASNPAIPEKVLWVLAHSYPALTVAELAAASGISGLTVEEAISGTTTAIWRYTDVDYDASYYWIDTKAEDLYWYLVGGANASSGMVPADFETTVSISGPATAQVAGSLIGPFVVDTNRPTVSVSVAPALAVTDANGAAVDTSAIVDGQTLYLDARAEETAGSAIITVSAMGSSATGMVVTLPTAPGVTPTTTDHGQSLILVASSDATTEAETIMRWAAEGIPSSPTPAAPRVLAETGGEPATGLLAGGVLAATIGMLVLGIRFGSDRSTARRP
jgi:TQXA domain-containing protein